jgi:hypothetical protein
MKSGANNKQSSARRDVFARTTVAMVLIVTAVAALAITSLIQSNKRASAQPGASATPATVQRADAIDAMNFDWVPAHGVPGLDTWPHGSHKQ